MKLRFKFGIFFHLFILNSNSFAACEYEKDKLKIAADACNAATGTTEWWTTIATLGGGIAAAASGNWPWVLTGLSGAIPGGFAARLCDLKKEREQQLKQCEEHEAFLAKTEEERQRLEWIEKQTKAASKVGARLFMNRVAEFEASINREINEMYEAYLDDGRISLDPENPTHPAIFQELLDGEAAIRDRYF